jgi:hypothetical protein
MFVAMTSLHSVDYDVEYSTADVVVQLVLFVPSLLILTPWVGAAQFGIYCLVRKASALWLQWTLCAASALLLVPYQRFLATADLTSNSTAPLAALFFPVYLAMLSLPVAWLVWWGVRRMTRSESD